MLKFQMPKMSQPSKMYHSGVGYLCTFEKKVRKLIQRFKMHESDAGHPGMLEIQGFKLSQPTEMD